MFDFVTRGVLRDAAGEPGSGGGNPPAAPAFDPEAFRADITKMVNGAVNSLKKEFVKAVKPPEAPPADPAPEHPEPGQPALDPAKPVQSSPELNAEMQKLKRELQRLSDATATLKGEREKERELRMESERRAAIKDAMTGVPFREGYADAFFRIVSGEVKRDEDGNFIAESDAGALPLKDYIRAMTEKYSAFVQPAGNGGSGAAPGRTSTKKQYTLEDIKPGMTREQQQEILSYIGNLPRS